MRPRAIFYSILITPPNEPQQKTDGREGRGEWTERKPAGCSGVKSALDFGSRQHRKANDIGTISG
jgi:hypothetical protein